MRNKVIFSKLFTGLFVLSLILIWSAVSSASGIQVSLDQFKKTFLKNSLYHFETDTTDEGGQAVKIYRAKSRRNSVSLHIKSSSVSKAVMMFFSIKNGEVTDQNAVYLKTLFEVFAPGWSDGVAWVKDTLAKMHTQNKTREKTNQGNASIALDYDPSFGMVKVSVW